MINRSLPTTGLRPGRTPWPPLQPSSPSPLPGRSHRPTWPWKVSLEGDRHEPHPPIHSRPGRALCRRRRGPSGV